MPCDLAIIRAAKLQWLVLFPDLQDLQRSGQPKGWPGRAETVQTKAPVHLPRGASSPSPRPKMPSALVAPPADAMRAAADPNGAVVFGALPEDAPGACKAGCAAISRPAR